MTIDSILLAGDFSAGSLENSYKDAFESIGIRTYSFGTRGFHNRIQWTLLNRVARRIGSETLWFCQRASRALNNSLQDAVLRAKVPAVLVIKGDLITGSTLRRIRASGVRVACYFPDNPFPPHPSSRPGSLPAARETDLYLVWSKRLAGKLKHAGVANPVFLPFAWDSEVFPYASPQPQGTWPGVLFFGGWDREREEFLEELACHLPLRIFGPDYWAKRTKARSRVRACFQGTGLQGAAAAKIIRESAITLNILRTQHIIDGIPDGLIMRHFEVPGSGGFLLSTRGGGATDLFREGETGEYFTGMAECVEKAKKYIADKTARRILVEQAHTEVALRHQYTHRAREILAMLQ